MTNLEQSDPESLHSYILNILRKEIEDFFSPQVLTEEQFLKTIFPNYRTYLGKEYGLRLSIISNQMLSKHFRNYKMNHNLDKINHKVIIELDRKMKWPYYINNTTITMYSDTDATWFTLHGKDLEQFLEGF